MADILRVIYHEKICMTATKDSRNQEQDSFINSDCKDWRTDCKMHYLIKRINVIILF